MRNRLLLISLAVVLVLSVSLVDCGGEEVPEITEYNLTISGTEGGSVTAPGEGAFTYDEGEKVNLAAIPDEGYQFTSWTGDVGEIGDVEDSTATITMKGNYSITATFAVKQYSLVIHSTEGGSVTTPGENAYTYDKGEVVNLVAVADEGYVFINWIGDVSTIADVNAASTTVTMNGGYSVTANFAGAIRDWYDLDAIRNNLDGSYILMNNLDSTTAGYDELAGPTANGGKGWQPIGSLLVDAIERHTVDSVDVFTGILDGHGYQIGGLFISRRDHDGVGLFGCVGEAGVAQDLGLVNAEVTGRSYVGGVVGWNLGRVGNSYCSGSVTGEWGVGGLVGMSEWCGIVSDSYYTGGVTGGDGYVGGLVGRDDGTVRNSYYNCDEVLIDGKNAITIGALFNPDFDQWLANDKFLDVNERLSQEDGHYVIEDVSDFKELLAFGQDGSLKFRLKNDLDLRSEPNFYVPYLAGVFDGNGHKISNLNFGFDFVSQVGLFGYIASGGTATGVGLENASVTGYAYVGALAGWSRGHVGNSHSTGSVTGRWGVGGLVGALHWGTVSDSHYTGDVLGNGWGVGGLLGDNYGGTLSDSYFAGSVDGNEVGGLVGSNHGSVSNAYYNLDEVLLNGENLITVGALYDADFVQWLANDKFLNVNERLAQEDGYYVINNVSDFKELLAFGQNGSLKFRLKNDLDLRSESNFYVPYLAGVFDGNGHKISNLSFGFDFISEVGVFGYVGLGGMVTKLGVESVKTTGVRNLGGVVGGNAGTVSSSYSTGIVTGWWHVGGLVGVNEWGALVDNSYSSSRVTGEWEVGGLVGRNHGAISNSHSTGSVTGHSSVGGLVGASGGTVSNSFWDTETTGQSTSDGGTGKTTAEMKNITTFSGAGWNIVAVADPGMRNPAYIWNIVDGQSYPFLSWQS